MKRGKLLLLGIVLSVNVSCEHHTYSEGFFMIYNQTEATITLSTNIESKADHPYAYIDLLPGRNRELAPGIWSNICALGRVEGERRAYTIGDFIANCEEAYVSATIEIDGEKVTRVWRCSERDDESGRQLFNLADCTFEKDIVAPALTATNWVFCYRFNIYETDFK